MILVEVTKALRCPFFLIGNLWREEFDFFEELRILKG